MASSYERKFIFLTSEDKSYAMTPGQPPKGHIEIEKRQQQVSFKVFVENVKPMEYQIQLLTSQGVSGNLGYLKVDDKGKGQEQYKAVATNIMGTGLDFKDFGVILIKDSENTQRIAAPLVGWLQKEKFEFKKLKKHEKEEKKVVESIKAEEEEEEEEKEVEEVQEEIEEIKTPEKMEIPEEKQKDLIKAEPKEELDLPQEIKPTEIGQPKQEEKIEQIEKEENRKQIKKDDEKFQGERKEIEEEKIEDTEEKEDTNIKNQFQGQDETPSSQENLEDEYWVDFDNYSPKGTMYYDNDEKIDISSPYQFTNENLEKLEKIINPFQPFKAGLEEHTWWRVLGHERELEVYYLFYNGSFVPLMYPYMQYRNIGERYIQEPNHWIFGVTYDEHYGKKQLQYYVYGILGRFCIQEQPFQGSTGFLYWHPLDSDKRERDALGYWLLYIDARTGAVTVPHRPTMPPVCKF